MGEAFITRRGGGAAGLNFEVVGGTTKPERPKENTIWINTAQKITRWDFSAEHPHLVSKTKNFICYPFYDPTVTTNGVAYTDNGDGTVKANGTAISDASFRLSFLEAADKAIYLPAGKYFLSGCPAGGSSTGHRVEVKSVASGATLAADYGAGAGFELDAPDVVRCNIVVANGATVSNLTFRPQLEKGSSATAFVKGDATGQVWIKTGTSSVVKFNALKKNGVQVYPLSTQQYVNKEWADVTSMSYRRGKWARWVTIIVPNTGIEWAKVNASVTQDSTSTTFSANVSAKKEGYAYYSFEADAYTELKVCGSLTVECGGSTNPTLYIGIFDGENNFITGYGGEVSAGTSDIDKTYDLGALTGVYQLGFYIRSNTSSGNSYLGEFIASSIELI